MKPSELKENGKHMTYDGLKEGIKQLEDGWTKEADDILMWIVDELPDGTMHHIEFYTHPTKYHWEYKGFLGDISIKKSDGYCIFHEEYADQCGKLQSFKNALSFLLDLSSYAKEKQLKKLHKERDDFVCKLLRVDKAIEELKQK